MQTMVKPLGGGVGLESAEAVVVGGGRGRRRGMGERPFIGRCTAKVKRKYLILE